jgi:protein CpxP
MNQELVSHPLFSRRVGLLAAGLVLSATAAAGPQGAGPFDGQGMEARLDRMTEQLSLTDAQRNEIKSILDEQRAAAASRRQQTRDRIDAVLTDEQRAARDARRAQRLDRRLERMTARLELTEAQQKEIRAIWENGQAGAGQTPADLRERVAAVLTDEQRERIASRNGRGGRPGGNGPVPRRGCRNGGGW